MKNHRLLSLLLLFLLAWASFVPATSSETPPDDEAAIRDLIARWYDQHRAAADGRPYLLLAPGAIDASPGYRYIDTGSAAFAPRHYHSLAATALKFDHEIIRLRLNGSLARVDVWERGYFYAWAAQTTYERAGDATFVVERQDDGRWLVLAHETNTVGIPPNRKTDPMPDLRELYYATEGKDRDPEADAGATSTPAPAPSPAVQEPAPVVPPQTLQGVSCGRPCALTAKL